MGWFDRLQATFRQDVEPAERSYETTLHEGSVDEIDPPDDIDELHHDIYEQIGPVASSIDQYVADVFEPGVRVQADADATESFFQDDFLHQAGVVGGERHQHFEQFATVTETQRLTRGTALVNLIPQDRETAIPDTPVTGFYHIPPETVTILTEEHKNILLPPDADDLPAGADIDVQQTQRGEVASYVQFDDQSILGRRRNDFGQDEIYLSQTDIAKAVYDVGIGGDGTDETGIWGRSILRPIRQEAEEYEQLKRDRAEAIREKAYGVWIAQFAPEVLEMPRDQAKLLEWSPDSIDSVMDELEGMDPGDVLEIDGPMMPEKFEGEVPDVEPALMQLLDDMLSPLPTPKYAVGFETNINQFVTERQEERYHKWVSNGRRYNERFWTGVFRTVAESHGLDPSGLEVMIEPKADDSPILSLTDEEVDRFKTYAEGLDTIAGPTSGAGTLVTDDTLRELIAQLPAEAEPATEEPVDETDDDVAAQFDAQFTAADPADADD